MRRRRGLEGGFVTRALLGDGAGRRRGGAGRGWAGGLGAEPLARLLEEGPAGDRGDVAERAEDLAPHRLPAEEGDALVEERVLEQGQERGGEAVVAQDDDLVVEVREGVDDGSVRPIGGLGARR